MAERGAERIVLVDGSALVYRAFFALPPHLTTKQGVHTNAVFGFAMMFKKLFAAKHPTWGAVVLDPGGKTTRDEKYPEYKAQRAPMPDELREQLPLIDKVIDANHFPRLRIPGFEADDVIGTLTRLAREAGHEVVIISSDKDFAQLIGDGVRMQDTLKDVVYDAELVRKKWGVLPEQMVDYLALVGDASDNIPGVDGIGQKGAQELLATFGSLDNLYRQLEEKPELFKGKRKTSLETGKQSAYLSRDLATIDRHVKLPVKLDELKVHAPAPGELNPLYKELEFYSLLTREQVQSAKAVDAVSSDVVICQTPDDVHAEVGRIEGSCAVVPLFDGRYVHGSLVGVALAHRPGHAVYVPLDDGRLKALVPFLQDPARAKVLHDAKACFVLLRQRGVTLRGVVLDVMLASFLVDPTKILPHHLEQVAKEYLQRSLLAKKDITGSGQKEKPLAALPDVEVAKLAVEQVHAVRELEAPLRDLLKERAQTRVHDELELPLSWVLADMEIAGIPVDKNELETIGAELLLRKKASEKKIHELAGHEFNIGSPKQLGTVLFDELKLPVIRRTKSGYSTDAEVLERLAPKSPIAKEILEYRRVDKLINTYTDVLARDIHEHTGRVHATFQQTVGATGRLITMDPDLQRTPVRMAEGRRIREAFVAQRSKDGEPTLMIDADWSQIELRLLAHVSKDKVLVDSFNRHVDVHRRTAAEIFQKPPEQITKAEREVGKTVNFSTIYGQGALALSQMLGVKKKDADEYIARYFALYAGVRAWLDEMVALADERGHAETLIGRRRIIPELKSKSPMDRGFGERVAANTPIQGSAADICKLAMLGIARRLPQVSPRARLLLQVHDELVLEAPAPDAPAVAALAKEVMETVVALEVPLVAEVGIGASWGAAH